MEVTQHSRSGMLFEIHLSGCQLALVVKLEQILGRMK
jgi:hypothetical protein